MRSQRALLTTLLLSLTLFACGGVDTPRNGEVISGSLGRVRFAGYASFPDTAVQVQGYDTRYGDWVNLGSPGRTGSDVAFVRDGINLYRFDMFVSLWNPGNACVWGGYEPRTNRCSKKSVQLSGGWYKVEERAKLRVVLDCAQCQDKVLATFDENAESCIDANHDAGMTWRDAADACRLAGSMLDMTHRFATQNPANF